MARIKISELPELDIATLDTTYVAGVYDNTTFKIPINRLTSSLDTTFATDLVVNAVSGTLNRLATTASFNSLSTSLDSRLDSVEIFSSSADSRYVLSGSIPSIPTGSFATTGSNIFNGSQKVNSFVTASYYRGSGRYLTNLTPTTNWNYEQEFSVKNTEQLTFSGDYILENTYLVVNGGDEEIEYSSNKSFKKEGSIFIGGNLLVKDSYIENDGLISVGGEVILIGNSQITGTGKII
jgi:hypothetical protein